MVMETDYLFDIFDALKHTTGEKVRGDRVTLKLDVSPELDALLRRLSKEAATDEAEILRRAIALYMVAMEAKKHGHRLFIVGPDEELLTEITA
jgi:hypothetical protein